MMWFSKEKKNDRKKTLNMIFFYESQRCKKKTPKNKPISLVDIFLAQKYMSKMLHSGKFERRMQDLCFKSDIGFWQTFACSAAEFPYSLQAVTCMYSHKRINLTKKRAAYMLLALIPSELNSQNKYHSSKPPGWI